MFPVLLWLTGFAQQTPKGARRLFLAIALLSIASFGVFKYLSAINPSAAFYLVTSRFWELGVGSMAFLAHAAIDRKCGSKLSAWKTLALILLVGLLFTQSPYDAEATAVAVGLTVILLITVRSDTLADSILDSRFVVYLGFISYSLYLWHWSVLAISRWTVGVQWWTIPFQVGLILSLSALSYRYVEQPFRNRAASLAKLTTIGLGFSMSVLCVLFIGALALPLQSLIYGGVMKSSEIDLTKGSPVRNDGVSSLPEFGEISREVISSTRTCNMTPHHLTGKSYQPKPQIDRKFISECLDSPERKIVLVGDSFAEVIAAHTALAAKQIGYDFRMLIGYGCPYPLDPSNIAFKTRNGCELDPAFLQSELLNHINRGDIVVLRLYFPKFQYIRYSNAIIRENRSGLVAAYDAEIMSFYSRIANKGATMLLIGSNPTQESNPACVNPQWFNRLQNADCDSLQLSSSLLTQFAFYHEVHLRDKFSGYSDGLKVVAPTLIFCDEKENLCSLTRGGKFLWSDNQHIVPIAIDLFYPQMLRSLEHLVNESKSFGKRQN